MDNKNANENNNDKKNVKFQHQLDEIRSMTQNQENCREFARKLQAYLSQSK